MSSKIIKIINIYMFLSFLISLSLSALIKQNQNQKSQNEEKADNYYTAEFYKSLDREIEIYKFDPKKECDLTTTNPLCINGGNRMYLPGPKVPNLLAHYQFDNELCIDSSGNQLHAQGKVLSGPSFGGIGSSAKFDNGNYLRAPNMKYQDKFTITFQLYLLNNTNKLQNDESHCTILQKGYVNNNNILRSPLIYYNLETKHLEIGISTDEVKEGEFLISRSRLLDNYWYHIAIVVNENLITLYINGIEDSTVKLNGKIIVDNNNDDSYFYIGNAPWSNYKCIISYVIDEMRIYDTNIDADFIQGEAAPLFELLEPNYVKIGCSNCTLREANSYCLGYTGYRLCTSIELHSGVYQITQLLGLAQINDLIWTHAHLYSYNENNNNNIRGLGMCCNVF